MNSVNLGGRVTKERKNDKLLRVRSHEKGYTLSPGFKVKEEERKRRETNLMEWYTEILRTNDGDMIESVHVTWSEVEKVFERKQQQYEETQNDDILLIKKLLYSNLPEHISEYLVYDSKEKIKNKTPIFVFDLKDIRRKTKKVIFFNTQTNRMLVATILIDRYGWNLIGPPVKTAYDLARILNNGIYTCAWEDIIYNFDGQYNQKSIVVDLDASEDYESDIIILSNGLAIVCGVDGWQVRQRMFS